MNSIILQDLLYDEDPPDHLWARIRAKLLSKRIRFRDLTGQTFGKLTVLQRGENIGKKVGWLCRCTCGKETIKGAWELFGGHTKSCGEWDCRWGNTKAERQQMSRNRAKARQKKYSLSSLYGLSLENYYAMLQKQDGKCAICEELMSLPNVDHCHRTKKVRELLCSACNFLLGSANEDIARLEKAIQYLRRHNE